jgi:hypothetical protein
MKGEKISYTFGRTIQLKQFEPIRFDCTYETTVKDGETPKAALKRAVEFVEDFIEEKSDEFIKGS